MDKYTQLVNTVLKNVQLNEYGNVMGSSAEEFEPTEKHGDIESALSMHLGGKNRRSYIRAGKCVITGKDAGPFRDEVSKREYEISGIGQKMQDRIFGSEDEDVSVEDNESLKKLGLTDEQLNAVAVAGKMATKAGGLGAAGLTQNKMNAAYGKLMRKIAKKVDDVAKAIK